MHPPVTNNLRQLKEVTSGAPLPMVAITINPIRSELGRLCHQQVQLALGQLIKVLKLNRAIKQVALEPLGIEFLGRDIQWTRNT